MVVDGSKGSVRNGWVYCHAGKAVTGDDAALMEGLWRMSKGMLRSDAIDPGVAHVVDSIREQAKQNANEKMLRRKKAAKQASR